MSVSPHTTSEDVIDVVTNVRYGHGKRIGKMGGIDIKNFEGF